VLKAISGLTMYRYLHKLQIVVREGLLNGRPGYKLASSMFAAIFQSAATFEFEHGNFKLAWRLCLESLRIEGNKAPEFGAGDGGAYDPLILLAAIYVRIGDLARAFKLQKMAIKFNEYVWERPAFLDSAGNWYLIPALSDEARIAYQQGSRDEAIVLAKAAVTQSYRGDRNCATFRRMNVLLAKLFLLGKDYKSTLRCLESMNYASFIEVDCSTSGFEVAVTGLCSQYGVSLS
jgi:tetratricopeptide (TPR) repeat protein